MKNKYLLSVVILASFLSSSAQALSVDEIVAKANHAAYYTGIDGKANVEMEIVDAQGRKRERSFTILRKDMDDQNDTAQRFYVFFHKPSDVNKTAFMVWKHIGQDDDRWLYLPALDLVKRIAASDERTSFVGSNFFYEDVSGRTPSEDQHELLEETDSYYVLKSTPKTPDLVEFAYYKNWIHKESFIPVKTEFFNKKDESYRVYEALKVQSIQGHPTVTDSKMTDKDRGGYTQMHYTKVQYDVGLPEDIFTERYLRAAPVDYLK